MNESNPTLAGELRELRARLDRLELASRAPSTSIQEGAFRVLDGDRVARALLGLISGSNYGLEVREGGRIFVYDSSDVLRVSMGTDGLTVYDFNGDQQWTSARGWEHSAHGVDVVRSDGSWDVVYEWMVPFDQGRVRCDFNGYITPTTTGSYRLKATSFDGAYSTVIQSFSGVPSSGGGTYAGFAPYALEGDFAPLDLSYSLLPLIELQVDGVDVQDVPVLRGSEVVVA